MSEFQAEALFLHLVVAFRVEPIEESYFLVGHGKGLVELGQDAELQHLVAEVAPVELHAEDGLVEVLQLGHGELLGQQFKAYRFEVNLPAQLVRGLAKDQVVVEGQRGNLVLREPLGLGGIVATLHLADTHQGVIGNGNHSLTGVAVDG